MSGPRLHVRLVPYRADTAPSMVVEAAKPNLNANRDMSRHDKSKRHARVRGCQNCGKSLQFSQVCACPHGMCAAACCSTECVREHCADVHPEAGFDTPL
jgi:hypothetical protein